MRKTLKTFIAALLVASASLVLVPQANAGPTGQTQDNSYIDRASKNFDGGGY